MTNNNFKIGIDARSISDRVCGVSRVATCLIEALSQIDTENRYFIYVDSIGPSVNLGANFEVKLTHCSRKNPIDDMRFFSIIKKDELDLFHSMHAWLPQFVPKRVKTIVTVHDLFSMTDPLFFIKYRPFHKLFQFYFGYLTKKAVRRADAVITVSNYCKNEIVKHFPVSNGKLHVIYNALGVSQKTFKAGGKSALLGNKYFLYIGNCRSYKNVEVLIDGFNVFRNKNPKVKLVVAGNDLCEHIKAKVRMLNIENDVVFIHNPTDAEISDLYRGATAFIFPSKQEGFGIPVVEAMSAGTPVIISDAEALVEVAGDAALVFRRDNPEGLALLMGKVYNDDFVRKELIGKGLKRASIFTWESSAIQLIKIYHNLLNKRENIR